MSETRRTRSRMTRRRLGATALATAFAGVASATHAQQGTAPSRARVSGASAIASRCAELTSSPTKLLEAPEGRALLRFKRELDDAAVVFDQRADSGRRGDMQRISQVQRGVDSLMQIFVRLAQVDGADGRTFTIRRGDSVRVMVNEGVSPSRVRPPGDSVRIVLNGRTRDVFEVIDGTMRSLSPAFEAQIRALQPQIAAFSEAARTAVSRSAASRTSFPMRAAAPSGWLGMHLSESKITIMSAEGPLTNYCDYPVIEAVDAGSPAERAGLNAGDTVVAYNGRDVRTQVVNYQEMLVPGQVLRMRVKRGTRLRDIPVTVGTRTANVTVVRTPCEAGTPCERPGQFSFSPSAPPRPPLPPTVSGFATAPQVELVMAGTGMAVVAGAQLSVVDDEFAQSLGVEPGLLVMRVPAGTPAAEAGLRAGDVIRAVNGVPSRDLTLLRRAFGVTSVREVKLTVSARGASPRILTLRW